MSYRNEDAGLDIAKAVAGLVILACVGVAKTCNYYQTSEERPVVEQVYRTFGVEDRILDRADKSKLLNELGISQEVKNDEYLVLQARPNNEIEVYAQKDKNQRSLGRVPLQKAIEYINRYPEARE